MTPGAAHPRDKFSTCRRQVRAAKFTAPLPQLGRAMHRMPGAPRPTQCAVRSAGLHEFLRREASACDNLATQLCWIVTYILSKYELRILSPNDDRVIRNCYRFERFECSRDYNGVVLTLVRTRQTRTKHWQSGLAVVLCSSHCGAHSSALLLLSGTICPTKARLAVAHKAGLCPPVSRGRCGPRGGGTMPTVLAQCSRLAATGSGRCPTLLE
jgi:hypothetical protein